MNFLLAIQLSSDFYKVQVSTNYEKKMFSLNFVWEDPLSALKENNFYKSMLLETKLEMNSNNGLQCV